jgi:hypothetical protein
MNKTPRTNYYWDKFNKDNIDGFALALKMRDHAYNLEEKMTDLMEWRIEVENELHTVTEQRDRLAVALRNCLPFITGDGCGEYSDAREALQSLTTNDQVEARRK